MTYANAPPGASARAAAAEFQAAERLLVVPRRHALPGVDVRRRARDDVVAAKAVEVAEVASFERDSVVQAVGGDRPPAELVRHGLRLDAAERRSLVQPPERREADAADARAEVQQPPRVRARLGRVERAEAVVVREAVAGRELAERPLGRERVPGDGRADAAALVRRVPGRPREHDVRGDGERGVRRRTHPRDARRRDGTAAMPLLSES